MLVGGLAVAAAPLALSAAGFSSGGIVAGSLAARLMSMAAIANGGGVAAASAGGWIAALQSAGAAGISASTNFLIGSTAGTLGGFFASRFGKKNTSEQGLYEFYLNRFLPPFDAYAISLALHPGLPLIDYIYFQLITARSKQIEQIKNYISMDME